MTTLTRAERREIKRERRMKRTRYQSDTYEAVHVIQDYAPRKENFHTLEAQTEAQAHYILSIDSNTVTFSIGPAGTGKTYVAVAKACEYLESNKVDRIILTRPIQDAEEDKIGALPGTLEEKMDPYLAPVRQLLDRFLGKSKVEAYIKAGKIVGIPLGFMRGMTFDRAFILADEMQNSTPVTMKLLLTRIGKWSKVVIDGDVKQKDIRGTSGLEDAVNKLYGVKSINTVEFLKEDIVRSDIVRHILDRYES
jgi:phosphate starvation-inducible PhoH-like protein